MDNMLPEAHESPLARYSYGHARRLPQSRSLRPDSSMRTYYPGTTPIQPTSDTLESTTSPVPPGWYQLNNSNAPQTPSMYTVDPGDTPGGRKPWFQLLGSDILTSPTKGPHNTPNSLGGWFKFPGINEALPAGASAKRNPPQDDGRWLEGPHTMSTPENKKPSHDRVSRILYPASSYSSPTNLLGDPPTPYPDPIPVTPSMKRRFGRTTLDRNPWNSDESAEETSYFDEDSTEDLDDCPSTPTPTRFPRRRVPGMLWRPPSRDGVRRSERLKRRYWPLFREQHPLHALFSFLRAPTPHKLLLTLPLALLLALYLLTLLITSHAPAPHTSPSTLSILLSPLWCPLYPLCHAWLPSRINTSQTLLQYTTHHASSLASFKSSIDTSLHDIPKTLYALAADIHTEGKFQQDLARTLSEVSAAETLLSLARSAHDAHRELIHAQETVEEKVAVITKLIRRFGGYIVQQLGPAEFLRPPRGWSIDVVLLGGWREVGTEAALRRSYRGLVASVRKHIREADQGLLGAQKRVQKAAKRLQEVGGEGKPFGSKYQELEGQLRGLVRLVRMFREKELWVFGANVAEMEGGEDGGVRADLDDLRAAVQKFYVVLDDLEEGGLMGLMRESKRDEVRVEVDLGYGASAVWGVEAEGSLSVEDGEGYDD